ncbi:hypothetical protein DUI87_14871 [Hirundo rustica rustica]|uniref:SH3 domain-containing protein n=1 Tax=Hirundo rustica rustica TaxID=333673 RepID=A0A3M0K615_HIRRU|nr:hypothetical protein DUI87_14871 [Hirundo rustica rustica]
MASSDGLQYRALYEYQKDREEDLALCPGDVLTVSRAGLLGSPNYKDGDERNPQGWLHGVNERTKERGDFPGTYVEYLGPARVPAAAAKARPRPLPLPPAGTPAPWGLPGQAEPSEHPALPEQALPTVARLIEALEKRGLDSEVLYRSGPGVLGDAELKQALLADASAVDMDLYEAQTLADALKWYLQELPTPLIPQLSTTSVAFSYRVLMGKAYGLFVASSEEKIFKLVPIFPPLLCSAFTMALLCTKAGLALFSMQAAVKGFEVQPPPETPGLEECGQRARALLAPPALPQPQALLLRQLAHHFCHLSQGSHRSRLSPRLLGELFGELLLRPAAASTEAGPELRARILESFIMASEAAELPTAPGKRRLAGGGGGQWV